VWASLVSDQIGGGGGEGGARRRVPDIAGEVGSGDDDLETPRRIRSSTQEPSNQRPGGLGTT